MGLIIRTGGELGFLANVQRERRPEVSITIKVESVFSERNDGISRIEVGLVLAKRFLIQHHDSMKKPKCVQQNRMLDVAERENTADIIGIAKQC